MRTSKFSQYAAETSKRTFSANCSNTPKAFGSRPDKTPISPDKAFVAVMNTLTVGSRQVGWRQGG